MKPVVYVAHPVSGDPGGNLRKVERWLRAFIEHVPGGVFVAPWHGEVSAYLGREVSPAFYDRVLADDEETVRRCDALIVVGGSSSGTKREFNAAVAAHKSWVSWPTMTKPEDVRPVDWQFLQRAVEHWTRLLERADKPAGPVIVKPYTVVTRGGAR